MKKTELNIIWDLNNSKEDVFIFLFEEYYVSLCAYSRRYVGRKDIAEEIVSETFFKIWENPKILRIVKSVEAYLFKAVYNNSLNCLRQLKKEEKLEDYFQNTSFENIGFAIETDEATEHNLITASIMEQIDKAVTRLPQQQQKAFRLKRFDGKKNKEVAEIMGLSIKTVETHLSKAMLTLRTILKD